MTHYPASVADWRRRAAQRLPRFLFDYIDGGASDERTLAANVQDFAALRLRQRVLVDVAQVAGVEKVRLTGGEPFARKGFIPFLARLHAKELFLS